MSDSAHLLSAVARGPPIRGSYRPAMSASKHVIAAPHRGFTSETVRDCATIAGAAVVLAIVLRPFQNVPFIDDWGYAWPVQHLLEKHEFLFPELLLNPIAAQVLWGALFCLPFGFSLTALRVSTWVLGTSAVVATYLLIRESHGTRRDAAIGAAVLGLYPVFPTLSGTFMTDVPCLTAMLWSIWLFVRALNTRRVGLVWISAATCAASVGCRIVGLGTAAAMIAVLLFHGDRWGRRPAVLAAPVLVVPFGAWLFLWTRARVLISADITWLPNSPQQRLTNLRYALGAILPSMLAETLLMVLVLMGIALLPLAAGMMSRAKARRIGLVFLLFAGAWGLAKSAGLAAWVPFQPDALWALREIGAAAPFVPGWQPVNPPAWLSGCGVALALASAATVVGARPRGALNKGEIVLAWNFAAHLALVAVLWLTYDRYALVFVPLTAVLVLVRRPALKMAPTIAALVAYGIIGLVGAHDQLEYNRALWSAVGDLRQAGIPPREIDGGYVVNGWLQYVHPDEAYRDASGKIVVPMVNDFADLTYTVADRPIPNHSIVRTYGYSAWLRPSGSIYVLKR